MFQEYPIKFQGRVFTILVLYIKDNTIHIIKKYILKKIKESPIFFAQAPIILNLSSLKNIKNWKYIYKEILAMGLKIIGITGCYNESIKNHIINSGIPIFLENKNIFDNKNFFQKKYYLFKKKKNETKIITQPVRSGQKIYAHQADLIVTNHVSSGAELIADGNIHIYGTMKGKVLAGVNGDITKNIFCTNCFAELISIAGEYLLIDQIPVNFLGKGVHIFLKNNILFIYPLL